MPSSSSEPKPGLPPRKETFLARYPRRLKLAVLGILLVALAVPFVARHAPVRHQAVQAIPADKAAPSVPAAPPQAESNTADSGPAILNPQDDKSVKMAPAPDPGLSEDTAEGSLPRIGEDGRQPWQVYARPFNPADKRPRVAIVVADLGLSRMATDEAINNLPANVTLAFDTQSPVVGAWCARARQDGHETLLMVPMEPFDYPRSDPGPNTLLTTLPNSDNLQRFYTALRSASGYVGVTTLSGSRFTTDPDKLTPILNALHKRGLMILDARTAPHSAVMDMARDMHVPAVAVSMRLDDNPSPEAVDAALQQLEKIAQLTGYAVGITAPLPVVLDRLQLWLKTLPGQGVALAPLSAMVR